MHSKHNCFCTLSFSLLNLHVLHKFIYEFILGVKTYISREMYYLVFVHNYLTNVLCTQGYSYIIEGWLNVVAAEMSELNLAN